MNFHQHDVCVYVFVRTLFRLWFAFLEIKAFVFVSTPHKTGTKMKEEEEMRSLPGSWRLAYTSNHPVTPRWRDTDCHRNTGRGLVVARRADDHPTSSPPASRPADSNQRVASDLVASNKRRHQTLWSATRRHQTLRPANTCRYNYYEDNRVF